MDPRDRLVDFNFDDEKRKREEASAARLRYAQMQRMIDNQEYRKSLRYKAGNLFAGLGGCGIAALLVVGLLALAAGINTLVIYLLWNWIVVALFHTATITFWQAFGVACLLSVIGGFFKSSSSSSK